jgi:polysaccharide pyruvyl transferase WcaK-like protein
LCPAKKWVTEMKNSINYVCWNVPNNLGEEALYIIDQAIFSEHGYELYRINNMFKEQYSEVTLIGGSTTIPLIILRMRKTKYAYIFGAAVEDPAFYGPFDQVLIDRFKKFNFRFIGVRGNISRLLLKDWGIKSYVIGDPCLSLKPSKIGLRDSNRIAINIGAAFSEGSWGDPDRVAEEIREVCRVLKKKGYELVLVPFWTNNLKEIERLSQSENIPIFKDWLDIDANLQFLSTCKLLIGEKLHSLVFSAAVNTPFIGIAYAPEHFDFVDSVGFNEYVLSVNEITAEKVLTMFDDLVDNYEEMQSKLGRIVNEFREKQSRFAAAIAADIESLPDNKWNGGIGRIEGLLWKVDDLLHEKASNIWKIWSRLFFLRIMRYL